MRLYVAISVTTVFGESGFADGQLGKALHVEQHRTEAYRHFRGRDPDVSALLRKRGFPIKN